SNIGGMPRPGGGAIGGPRLGAPRLRGSATPSGLPPPQRAGGPAPPPPPPGDPSRPAPPNSPSPRLPPPPPAPRAPRPPPALLPRAHPAEAHPPPPAAPPVFNNPVVAGVPASADASQAISSGSGKLIALGVGIVLVGLLMLGGVVFLVVQSQRSGAPAPRRRRVRRRDYYEALSRTRRANPA